MFVEMHFSTLVLLMLAAFVLGGFVTIGVQQ